MAEQNYRYELSSVGNPFSPFNQRDSWYRYEVMCGYDAPAFLARFAFTNDGELTDELNQEEKNEAITRAIVADPLNIYVRVRQPITQSSSTDVDD